MVSIRRRKLLGLCSARNSYLSPVLRFLENGKARDNVVHNMEPSIVHPLPSVDAEKPQKNSSAKVSFGTSDGSGTSTSKKQQNQEYPEVKRRKRHRRKQFENQEPCLMRGVYFKNMKWQAAIKVDKKQIHLGTVASQEEAARLYDRAAFMCGREPNFELSEEEKRELSSFQWDEFLAKTRSAISSKKHRRRIGVGGPIKSEPLMPYSDWDRSQGVDCSPSHDAGPDSSPS